MGRDFCRWLVCSGQKGGAGVGKTKKGKGTKWMVVADGQGIPLASTLGSASPAEVKLLEPLLETMPIAWQDKVQRLILDRGYDSDPLRTRLNDKGIEMICPHRRNRKKPKTQDGRPLRRYKRRWKVERAFAWLGSYRRLLVRWERDLVVYRGFFHLACALIALNRL